MKSIIEPRELWCSLCRLYESERCLNSCILRAHSINR